MNFEHAIDKVIAAERGYVDHPDDRGGPTNYGITVATARAYGYRGDMRDLPLSLAREIYRNRYIVEPKFDLVTLVDERVGFELIDTGVNMSPSRAAEFFQRWLNVFNAKGSRYADLFVDGRIGPVSVDAFRAFRRWRGAEGAEVMFFALNCSQGAKYLEFAENRESQESFVYGWMRERVMAQLKAPNPAPEERPQP